MTLIEIVENSIEKAKCIKEVAKILENYPELLDREPRLAKFVELLKVEG